MQKHMAGFRYSINFFNSLFINVYFSILFSLCFFQLPFDIIPRQYYSEMLTKLFSLI